MLAGFVLTEVSPAVDPVLYRFTALPFKKTETSLHIVLSFSCLAGTNDYFQIGLIVNLPFSVYNVDVKLANEISQCPGWYL